MDFCTYRQKEAVEFYERCVLDDSHCGHNWKKELNTAEREYRWALKVCGGLIAILIIESLVALVASVLCCRGICGGCRSGDCCSAECCDSSFQGKILFYVILF